MAHAAERGEGGAGEGDEEAKTAWRQSKSERRALRSQYVALRNLIREAKGDADLSLIDAAIGRIAKLHGQVQRPREQVADAEALLDIANALIVKTEKKDGPAPAEFVTALLKKFGLRSGWHDASKELVSWSNVGTAVSPLFMNTAGYQTMNGPMDLIIKERKRACRRESEPLLKGRVELDELTRDPAESNDIDRNMAIMFNLLRRNKRVKLENLILNRQSFAQTVENIFALSFLVKDGKVEIAVDGNGEHLVNPKNAPSAKSIKSGDVFHSQFVFRLDCKDWKIMKDVVEPGEVLMPHRFNDDSQYRTVQSCPIGDDSQLDPASRPLKANEGIEDKEHDISKRMKRSTLFGDGFLRATDAMIKYYD